jgi:iron(III) transport system permease protein
VGGRREKGELETPGPSAAQAPVTVTDLAPSGLPAAGPAPPRRRRFPLALGTTSALVVAVLALPLAFLVLQAVQTGWSELHRVLFRSLSATLLWNTLSLTVVVTALCALVGTGTAWLVERTDLPLRRLFAVLLVLPIAVPDFVVSFGWVQLAPGISGFSGAVLVMTFAVYPFVYLPVAAALRRADPAEEEVARSLGQGPVATFFRVTVPQVRLAVVGGSLVVALVVLAEYGAFEILRYRTFTTEIFTEYHNFQGATAAALSLVLVVLSLLVLGAEGASRGRGRVARVGAGAPRPPSRHRLGRTAPLALAAVTSVVALSLGVPFGEIVSLLHAAGGASLPGAVSTGSALLHTLLYSVPAGLLATAAAVPLAALSLRHPSRPAAALERSAYLVLGLPGIVIALSLVYVAERYAAGALYGSPALLIAAYSIMFFPLALVAVRASLAQAPVRLEEVARSLGRPRLEVFARVTLPLVAPGLAVAFALVFLEALTELTATLVLVPPNTETLSTQFWALQTNGYYGQAALYALIIVGVAAVPGYVLGRWFDRLPGQ